MPHRASAAFAACTLMCTWLSDGSGAIVRTGTETIAAETFSRSRSADYRLGVSTEKLAPGWYLLSLEAALPGALAQRKDVTLRVLAAK